MEKTDGQRLIESRRTIRMFTEGTIETKELYDLLASAHQAPFHNKIEPWNAYLFNGDGKEVLLDALEPAFTDGPEAKREKVAGRIRNAAACIYVTTKPFETEKDKKDALLATATFIQNFHLLCSERDIGLVWRTGGIFEDARLQEMIGADGETFVGLLQLGRFEDVPPTKRRQSIDSCLTIFE
ncbi:nitroreductase [Exiguobacterium sp.]|uniref:nitroreductase family protein n=1 Tax=Exiguobacterium sp. TaxID=44751 RepID=UPI00391A70BA